MTSTLNRRQALHQLGFTGAAAWAAGVAAPRAQAAGDAANVAADKAIRYSLNTSTIRGQNIPLDQEVDLVAAAGYDAIEPWLGEIQSFVNAGGSLADLRKRIADRGLTVESAIGFASWIVDDEQKRAEGVEALKRDMDLVRQIGGHRIAAPPVGATEQTNLDLFRAAERYAKIVTVGRDIGITPQLEVWGFSKSLSRLGEVMLVAIESGCPDACVLPDVYHLFKGGTDFQSVSTIHSRCIQVMHLNDYPADLPRATIADKDRVYPGDGIAPLAPLIAQLRANGFQGVFSLELFNPTYWKQPAEEVLRTGLAKMKDAVTASLQAAPFVAESQPVRPPAALELRAPNTVHG